MSQYFLVLMLLSLAAALMMACQPGPAAVAGDALVANTLQEPAETETVVEHGTVLAAGGGPTTDPVGLEAGKVSAGPSDPAMGGTEAQEVATLTLAGAWNGEGGISVTGTGQVGAPPDLATLNLGVEAFAETVKEARDQAATANQRVVAALIEEGIAEEDIATRYFNIRPRYGREGETVVGYRVNNRLTVKSRDLADIGDLIDAVTEAGGDLIRFQGLEFSIEDTKPLEEEAREAAVADLKAKAGQLAELMGVEVGPAVSIAEHRGGYPVQEPWALAATMGLDLEGDSTQVRAGEVQVTVTLQAVFTIEQAGE